MKQLLSYLWKELIKDIKEQIVSEVSTQVAPHVTFTARSDALHDLLLQCCYV